MVTVGLCTLLRAGYLFLRPVLGAKMTQRMSEYLDLRFDPADVSDEVYDSLRQAMSDAAQETTDTRKRLAIEAARRQLRGPIENQPA